MMNFIEKAITSLFFFLVSAFCLCDDFYKNVFDFAKLLETSGAEKEAALEYKRYLFLQSYSEGDFVAESCDFLASYYEKNGNLEKSLQYIKIGIESLGDSRLSESYEMREIDLLLASAIENDIDLFLSPVFCCFLNLKSRNSKVKGYAYIAALEYLLRTKKTERFFNFYSKANVELEEFLERDEDDLIFHAFHDYIFFKRKNPDSAYWLSIFPGAGQFYAGDVSDALNAFALNGILIGYGVYSLLNLNFFDVAVLYATAIPRFYKGNLYNARKAAELYNSRMENEIFSPVILMLQSKRLALRNMK